ncbi:MAG: TetR/AcrR family transcriptional regulator [Candidatus Bipolaricaulia bacterium]
MEATEQRTERREVRREQILNSALKVFAARGVKEAIMEEVAAEAGMGKGTIYYYFPSKEALLEEIVATTVDYHFNGILEVLEEASSPLEVAEGIIAGSVVNYKRNPRLFKVFYMVLAEPRGRVKRALEVFTERHLEWLKRLEGAVSSLLLEHGLAPKSFIGFMGTHVHGIILLATGGRDAEELKEESLEALRGLLR